MVTPTILFMTPESGRARDSLRTSISFPTTILIGNIANYRDDFSYSYVHQAIWSLLSDISHRCCDGFSPGVRGDNSKNIAKGWAKGYLYLMATGAVKAMFAASHRLNWVFGMEEAIS